MPIKIRYNTFETNSSSQHTLVLRPIFSEGQYEIPSLESVIKYIDEYHWGWDVLETPAKKLGYLLTHAMFNKELIEDLQELFDLWKYTKSVERVVLNPGYSYGQMIDHQSFGEWSSFVNTKKLDQLEQFILSPSVNIIIGNDNSSVPIDLLYEYTMIYEWIVDIDNVPYYSIAKNATSVVEVNELYSISGYSSLVQEFAINSLFFDERESTDDVLVYTVYYPRTDEEKKVRIEKRLTNWRKNPMYNKDYVPVFNYEDQYQYL